MPVECDDEYWEGPHAFQQPQDKPSTVTFFTCLLRLNQILGVTLRTLVSHPCAHVCVSGIFFISSLVFCEQV